MENHAKTIEKLHPEACLVLLRPILIGLQAFGARQVHDLNLRSAQQLALGGLHEDGEDAVGASYHRYDAVFVIIT